MEELKEIIMHDNLKLWRRIAVVVAIVGGWGLSIYEIVLGNAPLILAIIGFVAFPFGILLVYGGVFLLYMLGVAVWQSWRENKAKTLILIAPVLGLSALIGYIGWAMTNNTQMGLVVIEWATRILWIIFGVGLVGFGILIFFTERKKKKKRGLEWEELSK